MWKDSDPRDSDARDEALWDARERADDVRDRHSTDPRDVFRDGLQLPRGGFDDGLIAVAKRAHEDA